MNSQNYSGLSDDEVKERQAKFGENALVEKKSSPAIYLFLAQFKSPLIYVLLFVAIISLIFREYSDFGIIFVVILLNSLMGFYQEYNAQKTLLAIKKFLKPKAIVIRNGKRIEIETKELTPGDIIILASGDQIPSDGKAVESVNLLVNESVLTGEAEAVNKEPGKDSKLFMGTTVLSGIAIMEVEKIGTETEIGKISQSLSEIKEGETPMQKKLNEFSKKLVWVVAVLCLIIFTAGILQHRGIWEMLRYALVLSVAAIPGGLPIAATVILSLGLKRILKRHGLVKKLLSVETLGSTSVICTDKTGTLTTGIMQVVKAELNDLDQGYLSLILANQQKDNLEVSLWKYVEAKSQIHPKEILANVNKIYEEPFNNERKYSLSIVEIESKSTGYILGAPEIVLGYCSKNKDEEKKILSTINSWASDGIKVVGAAYKQEGDLKEKNNWNWLGIVGIEDPVRDDAKEAINKCQEAGIKIKIVTGDHTATAIKIGEKLGLPVATENVMESYELEQIPLNQLAEKIENITIFGRITPGQKLKIVEALQNNGEVVAMTGDGVNDALALKKADIAVVVSGASDIAKEVADLILLDDNLQTIYAACEEGRTILSNIKKVVSYSLSNSFVEIVLIFAAVLLSMPVPLTVVMVLVIHLVCDGPIDIMFGFESRESHIMKLKPKQIQNEKIFDRFVVTTAILVSLIVGSATMLLFRYNYSSIGDLAFSQTLVFAVVASVSVIYVFSFKSLKNSILRHGNFFSNKYLLLGIIYGIIIIVSAIYIPQFNRLLGTVPLAPVNWLWVLAIGIVAAIIVEINKFYSKKY